MTPVNDPPVLAVIGNQVALQNITFTLLINATDVDSLDLNFSVNTTLFTVEKLNATLPGFAIFAITREKAEPEPVVNETVEINQTVEPEVNETIEPPIPPVEPPKKPYGWIALGVIVALAVLAFAWQKHYHRKAHELHHDAHVPQQLKEYIAGCRKKGFDDEKIRKRLLSAGWDQEMVNKAL